MKTLLIQSTVRSPVTHACMVALLTTLAGCAHGPVRYSAADFNIMPVSDVPAHITAPVPIRTVAPVYPYEFRRLGIQGTADVLCLVDENGGVQNAGYLSATYPDFAVSAVAATEKWSFMPGTVDGRRTPLHVLIPFRFSFSEGRAYADLERLEVK